MRLLVLLSLVSASFSFAPSALTTNSRTPLLTTSRRGPSSVTTAFLFGRRRRNDDDGGDTAVLDRPEEEMMKINGEADATSDVSAAVEEPEKEQTETEKLLAKVKAAGTAGVISYAAWELAFWFISLPVVLFGYKGVTGHWPDFQNSEDMAKLGAEAFAFVNFARFAVPLRIGLALSTTPWIQENIVDKFLKKEGDTESTPEENKAEQPTE